MKALMLLILFISSASVLAKSDKNSKRADLLYCLGQEELSLHNKKRTGPHYFLNQHFINEAASSGEFKLKKKYYHEICVVREYPPSVGLLRSILLHDEDIFKQVKTEDQNLQALYQSGYQSIIAQTPEIFFQFLALIQTQTKYPHCLKDNIPKIYELTYKFQYLREELDLKELLNDKKAIDSIFTKLKYLEAIYSDCDKKQRELDKKIKTKN